MRGSEVAISTNLWFLSPLFNLARKANSEQQSVKRIKEKTWKTKLAIVIFLPVFFPDSDTAVAAIPPPNSCNTRLKGSQRMPRPGCRTIKSAKIAKERAFPARSGT